MLYESQNPDSHSVTELVDCLVWSFSSRDISHLQVEQFMQGITVEEPDPALVDKLYQKYCDSIHETGLALARKLKGQK